MTQQNKEQLLLEIRVVAYYILITIFYPSIQLLKKGFVLFLFLFSLFSTAPAAFESTWAKRNDHVYMLNDVICSHHELLGFSFQILAIFSD